MSFLEVDNIGVFYGDVQVVFELSLHIEEGEVVSIIGGNGAGKSTLLNTISGLMQPSKGAIVSMTRAMARELAQMGGGGLTANTFVPAAVAGEASEKLQESLRNFPGRSKTTGEGPVDQQIIKRRGTAEEMVGPIEFMVSDASDFMTGSIVFADGGGTRH